MPICTAPGDQQVISMLADGAGGAFIFWDDDRGHNLDIYGQRISSAGQVQWTTNGVKIAGGNGDQTSSMVASDGAGGTIVGWTDVPGPTHQNVDIVAQRVNGAGQRVWTNKGVTLCHAAGSRFLYGLRPDGAGGAIAGWLDGRASAVLGFGDTFGQRVNASGQTLWTPNGIALSSGATVGLVRVAEDGAGGGFFIWGAAMPTTDYDLFARHVTGNGTAQSQISICTAPKYQQLEQAISDGSGGAFIVWGDARNDPTNGNPNNDIYAQHLSASDAALWASDGIPVTQDAGGQFGPTAALDGAGGAWFSWYSTPYQGQGIEGAFAQHLDASGNPAEAPDTISTFPSSGPITSNGSGGIVAAFVDGRNGNNDIYAQIVPPPSMAAEARAQNPDGLEAQPRTTFGFRAIGPNPARNHVGVDFVLPKTCETWLVIRDVQGRTIRMLREGVCEAGLNHVAFDLGVRLPRGIYLVELQALGARAVQRLAVIH